MSVGKIIELANKHNVLPISNVVIQDPRFPIWSGSSKPNQHHYGKGGLAIHTSEVIELCLRTNEYFKSTGKDMPPDDKVFLAALFHDCGKMWDYEPTDKTHTNWQGGPHKRLIHHISRSGVVWMEAKQKFSYKDDHDEILHAILSHHGQREWGSPVAPATRLAWLLHLCDGLSARIEDCVKWDRIKEK